MTKTKIATRALTGLIAFALIAGGAMDVIQPQMVVEEMDKLRLPLHLLTLVGVWKVLGGIALVAPVPERLREWAFAGIFFDFTGAAYLHAAVGDTEGAAAPAVFAVLLVVSYLLRRGGLATLAASPPASAMPKSAIAGTHAA